MSTSQAISARGLYDLSQFQSKSLWNKDMMEAMQMMKTRQFELEEKQSMVRQELAAGILAITKNPKPKARAQINKLYRLVGFKEAPKIVWYGSPKELLENKEILNKQGDYPQNAIAFKHLTSFIFTERRNSTGWGSRRGNSNQERAVDHIFSMTESNLIGVQTPNQRITDMAIGSFKYGVSWAQLERREASDSEWDQLEPILEKLAQTTTGFILSADTAHVVLPPVRISLNDSNVLDNDEFMAIEWPNGDGLHALRGVWFNAPMWQKLVEHKIETKEALGLIDVDQRRVAISYLKPEKMIEALKAKLVNEGKERHYQYAGRHITRVDGTVKVKEAADITIRNRLYRTMFFADNNRGTLRSPQEIYVESIMVSPRSGQSQPPESQARYFLHYNDPSTGEDYISFATQGVRERGKDADAVMAWKHHMTRDEYLNLYLEA